MFLIGKKDLQKQQLFVISTYKFMFSLKWEQFRWKTQINSMTDHMYQI